MIPDGTRSRDRAPRTVAFETLGCKLNQYETDSIATTLLQRGYVVAPFGPGADAYVINSCTVTNKADRKSRNTLYRAERLAETRNGTIQPNETALHPDETGTDPKEIETHPNETATHAHEAARRAHAADDATPGTPVILTGCFVDSHPGFDRSTRRTTYLVDNKHKNTIPDLLEAHFRGETVDPFTLQPDVFGFSTPEQVFHTRTNIKIQDGCDNFCTFCIIPRVRGRARSRPVEEVLREAREAIERGSRELILTGVNMSRYRGDAPTAHGTAAAGTTGTDHATGGDNTSGVVNGTGGDNTNGDAAPDFVDLVQAILELPGEFRLRISSLEPDGLNQRFVRLFEHPRMCPHLHLCLQSGSDRVLLRMRRMYTTGAYRDLAEKLRELDPAFNLTTDLIVGFPGEEDADLTASIDAVRDYRFGHVHLFPFSVRAGTRAERMDGAVDNREKRRRAEAIQDVALEEKRRYRSSLVGKNDTVLVEKTENTPEGTVAYGLGRYYVPIVFSVPAGGAIEPNRFYPVTITGVETDRDEPRLLGRWGG